MSHQMASDHPSEITTGRRLGNSLTTSPPSRFLATSPEKLTTKFSKPPPVVPDSSPPLAQGTLSHFSSWLVAGGRGVESTGRAHDSPTSYTLLCPRASCSPLWNQQFILYQQGREHALEGGGAHCAALPRQWGHMGNRRISRSPFQRTIKQAQRIMRGSGHFRVTVFSITTDEKRGKVILSPFRAIIGETQGGEIYGFWTIPFLVDTLRMARAEIMATHHVHQINIMSEAAARGDLCVLTPGPREISLFLSFHFFKCILDTQ